MNESKTESPVAQTKLDRIAADKQAIQSMCGCFTITFDYAEIFPSDPSYRIREPYHEEVTEWVFAVEETDREIVIQHLLIAGENMVIKHWREDWIYENTDFYFYRKDRSWNYIKLLPGRVAGQWTQKVYQVDDSPRYEATAPWIHIGADHYWEAMADAPLPRRETSRAGEYDVLRRTNRHRITGYGWLHEQDNQKVIRNETGDHVLVSEKGLNRYARLDDGKCDLASVWWDSNREFWKLVREEWSGIFARKTDLHLLEQVDGKSLSQHLSILNKEFISGSGGNGTRVKDEIHGMIGRFVIPHI